MSTFEQDFSSYPDGDLFNNDWGHIHDFGTDWTVTTNGAVAGDKVTNTDPSQLGEYDVAEWEDEGLLESLQTADELQVTTIFDFDFAEINLPGIGVRLGYDDAGPHGYAVVLDDGVIRLIDLDDESQIAASSTSVSDTSIRMRVEVDDAATPQEIRGRVWDIDASEPASWQIDTSDDSYTSGGTGLVHRAEEATTDDCDYDYIGAGLDGTAAPFPPIDVTIEPPVGDAIATGHPPTVTAASPHVTVSPPVGTATATGLPPTVTSTSPNATISPPVGTATASGLVPTVSAGAHWLLDGTIVDVSLGIELTPLTLRLELFVDADDIDTIRGYDRPQDYVDDIGFGGAVDIISTGAETVSVTSPDDVSPPIDNSSYVVASYAERQFDVDEAGLPSHIVDLELHRETNREPAFGDDDITVAGESIDLELSHATVELAPDHVGWVEGEGTPTGRDVRLSLLLTDAEAGIIADSLTHPDGVVERQFDGDANEAVDASGVMEIDVTSPANTPIEDGTYAARTFSLRQIGYEGRRWRCELPIVEVADDG